jgi:rhodanese-related sulfurtransferase
MNYITPIELKQKMDTGSDLTLLDVREDYEREICQIGGLHIPMGEVANRLSEINADSEVIVLCRSGKRAEAVANYLVAEAEMKNVTIVEGGILGWIDTVDNSLEAY